MNTRPYHGDTRHMFRSIRLLVIFLLAALLIAALGMGISNPRNTAQAAYTWASSPSWTEDFNGLGNWTIESGDGCSAGICGWGNNEKEWYTSNNVKIASVDGVSALQITASKVTSGACYYGTCQYNSGKLKSNYNFQYGKVEARIKMDKTGQGLWPAFWMLGMNGQVWPGNGEIDIMENRGSQASTTSSAIHSPNHSGGANIGGARTMGSSMTSWHIFSVEWEDSQIRFYSDGVNFKTVNKADVGADAWPFDDGRFYFILNLAVGGLFDGDPASGATYFPASMYVDYIKVYPKATTTQATPTRTPTATSSGNVARGKPATASSANGTNTANFGVDGNGGTRWESVHGVDPQWIRVDLGTSQHIGRVKLSWEGAYAKSYQVQVSADGNTWSTPYSTTTGDGGLDDIALNTTGRYVRMYGTVRGTSYGYSLWEFEVYN